MTIEVFSRDVIPIIQAILTFFGLGILGIVWWQIRQTTKWNTKLTGSGLDIGQFEFRTGGEIHGLSSMGSVGQGLPRLSERISESTSLKKAIAAFTTEVSNVKA